MPSDTYDSIDRDGLPKAPQDSSLSTKNVDFQVGVTEDTPLLKSPAPSTHEPIHRISHRWIVLILITMLTLLEFGDQLMDAPLTRVYESIYCYEYWEEHDPSKLLTGRMSAGPGALQGIDEKLCKIPEIQSKVAALIGNQNLFNGIPSLVLAVPFGMLADHWGRKPIIMMGICSFPLAASWISSVCWFWRAFDIRLVWLSALHGIFGGSTPVVVAVLLTIVSDVVPEDSRASVLFTMNSAAIAMDFLVPSLAAVLMAINSWIPILLGLGLEFASVPLVLLVPETLHHHRALEADREISTVQPSSGKGHPSIRPLREIGSLLRRDWRISAVVATFLLHQYINAIFKSILLQYASTKYSITFSRATFVLSLRAGFTIAVFLILVPWLSHIMIKRWGYSAKGKDLVLARASAIVMALGWLFVGLASNVPLFIAAIFISTLGAGYFTLVRSFVTSVVSSGDFAKLYTIMSVVDTVGFMGGSPLFAWLFKVGLSIGGVGLGLPLLGMAMYSALCAGTAFCIRIRKHDRGEQVETDVEEADPPLMPS